MRSPIIRIIDTRSRDFQVETIFEYEVLREQ